jgi:hypothetical protein
MQQFLRKMRKMIYNCRRFICIETKVLLQSQITKSSYRALVQLIIYQNIILEQVQYADRIMNIQADAV